MEMKVSHMPNSVLSSLPEYTDEPSKLVGSPNNHVDWQAILAGATIAIAISTLLTAFGAGVGLSLSSSFSGKGIPTIALGIANGLWVMWVAISSFMTGGYITGRLRKRSHDSTEHESDIRDGVHGLVVWGLGILFLAWFASSAMSNTTKATDGMSSSKRVVAASDSVLDSSVTYSTDKILRGSNSSSDIINQDKAEITHIMNAIAFKKNIQPDDKAYLIEKIMLRTGINKEVATVRLNDSIAQATQIVDEAAKTTEAAKKAFVIIAFLTAASLAISAVAAWRAACAGGNHRDQNIDLSHLTQWR